MMNQTNEENNNEPVTDDELAQCKAHAGEYLNGWQRAKADFVNYKNEEARRLEDTARFMTRSLVNDLLPVLDSFDLACQQMEGKSSFAKATEDKQKTEQAVTYRSCDSSAVKGILLIRSQLLDALKKRGLEVIPLHPGDIFNPELHEALGEMESDLPEGVVAEEFQKGYMLQGKVIRPARVRLSKGK